MKQYKRVIPANQLIKKFRTEQDLIDYYEMKAVDPFDNSINEEEEEDYEVYQRMKHPNIKDKARKRSDSLKKNIKKFEQKMQKQNLNDSRYNDFEGFDDDFAEKQQYSDELE